MKIVFLDAKTLGKDISLDRFKDIATVDFYETTQPNQVISRIKDAQIVVTNKVVIDKNIIDNSNLKFIQVTATGMNNIDIPYAKQNNIIVKNVAGYSTNSVVQTAFAFIFKFIQDIEYLNSYAKTKWCNSDSFTHIIPFGELANKKVGIIGLGTIGKQVANIANEFGAEVYYYSTSHKNNNNKYTQLSLEELLKTCDIISIHAPLNENTANLLNKENLVYLKEKTILLNLGRGGIVNENDIALLLDQKEIYFATDVTTIEPIGCENPLLKVVNKNRLILTPHIAWASIEARKTLIQMVYENLNDFIGKQ